MPYLLDQTLHQSRLQIKHGLTFWLYFGLFGVCLKKCVHKKFSLGPFSVFFGFTQALLMGSSFNTGVSSTPVLYPYLTACHFHPLYILNTNVASAFNDLLLIGFYSLCPFKVYLSLLATKSAIVHSE